jgi:hypothetical protein
MIRSSLLLVALVFAQAPLSSLAQSNSGAAIEVPSLATASARSDAVEIQVKYPTQVSYQGNAQRYLLGIYVSADNGTNLPCIKGYLDFQFRLTNARGEVVATNPKLQDIAPPDYVDIGPYDGNFGRCGIARSTHHSVISLPVLYPNLRPGRYSLVITFSPKNAGLRSSDRITIPPMSFDVVP